MCRRHKTQESILMRLLICALLIAGVSQSAIAQSRDSAATGPILTLDEAISLARRNNPTHLQTGTARSRAGAALRSAYGGLLPDIQSNFSTSYREGRPQLIGGQSFGQASDILTSDAGISLQAQYSVSSLLAPKVQRANLDAAEADVTSSESTLRSSIVTFYLNALQAQARAVLQDTLLLSTQAQLELAQARAAVGAATTLDVRRAEVAVGQQQVAVLRERNNAEIEKLRLFQQIGVAQPENVQLAADLPMIEPTVTIDDLLTTARRANPALIALKSRQDAANLTVRQAQSGYLPTLSLRTGISGYTSQLRDIDQAITSRRENFNASRADCLVQDQLRVNAGLPSIIDQCNQIVFTDADASAMRSSNQVFPFDMTRDPLSFSATLSLPIFDRFNREQRVQEASAQRNDARYRVRAQELQLTADVTAAHLNLLTAFRTVRLQEQNSQTARQALELAQERFRVGANTFVDVSQARADYERAETDRINAIYDFHKAYATLESAVGRPLR
jgi:outer membrane protein